MDDEFYETLASMNVTVDYDWCLCGVRACDDGMRECHVCAAEKPNP